MSGNVVQLPQRAAHRRTTCATPAPLHDACTRVGQAPAAAHLPGVAAPVDPVAIPCQGAPARVQRLPFLSLQWRPAFVERAARVFSVNGVPLQLTCMEHRVLTALASKPGTLVSKVELAVALYADKAHAAESNVIEVLISRVRKELRLAGAAGAVETVRGLGYRYTGPVA